MGTRIIEHTFMLVNSVELDEGIKHASKQDGVTLLHSRLRAIANEAGKTMHAEGVTPRVAAARAMQAYHNNFPLVRFEAPYFDAYVHAVAKIMSNRSPRVAQKRIRDRRISELQVTSYNLAATKNMDPIIQQEIANMIDKRDRRQKADVH